MHEREIFIGAIQIDDPAARAEYVKRACASDIALRERMESLLLVFDRNGTFLTSPVVRPENTQDHPGVGETANTIIGPYRLLEQIGEGGMGAVWMAQQTSPVTRLVAIKLIKPGMDSRQVLARFEAERQALALMDHPNIARVFDAGTTPEGRPYFVMELVKGMAITKYCDENRLTPRQRLELFVPVCQAIQHAHQKGIIHRDIKPTNVLVTLYDGKPVPKVIDFGVAKAIGQQLTEQTLNTGFDAVVGTFEYMSPEQAGFNQLDIDTRSDIYSLGVLLYELLAGSPPFSRKELEKDGMLEMLRVIREREPSKPSARLSTAEGLPGLAMSRGMEPKRLTALVRGEIDWIVMKGLEKDRNRRYETATSFAADVQRYLNNEAVQACPPSALYQLQKSARRNGRILSTACLFALTLIAAVVVSAWQASRAREAQHQAENDRSLAETAQRQAEASESRANTESAIARAVNDFLRYDLLRQVDKKDQAWWTEYPNLTVREALDRAAARIGDRFHDKPLVEAGIRETIGEAYQGVGESSLAAVQHERVLSLRREHLGTDSALTLDTMSRLVRVYGDLGRFPDEVALSEEILKTRSARLGSQPEDTFGAMDSLIDSYRRAGQSSKALAMARQLHEIMLSKHGPTHPSSLDTNRKIAACLMDLGRQEESLALFRETLDLYRTNPEALRNSLFHATYARALFLAGRLEEAERFYREDLARVEGHTGIRKRVNTAHAMAHLTPVLLKQGRFEEAESMARQAKTIYETTINVHSGPGDVRTFDATSMLGGALLGQKRYLEAEPLLLKGYEGLKQREKLIGNGNLLSHSTVDALQRVIQLYEQTNQQEKLRAWREKNSLTK